MKRSFILITMLSSISFAHAADTPKKITPSDFTDVGKKILTTSLATWVSVAKENNIPTDKGLAKLFVDMHNDGAEKMVNEQKALEKANEYNAEFLASPAFNIIKQLHSLKPDEKNYAFDGAQGVVPDLTSVLRQYELCNSLNKRSALWKLPSNGRLVIGFLLPSEEKAKIILKLNEDNNKLNVDAIRGQGLFSAYYLQQEKQQ
jgi:hypothetical protein